jgi:hypothetical protein
VVVFGAPVFHRGNLAFFVAIFSEMIRLFADAVPHLLSIHLSITRESKWRYRMKAIPHNCYDTHCRAAIL